MRRMLDDSNTFRPCPNLPIPAVKNQKVVALTDPKVLLPSSNLPQVARDLYDAIHGAAEVPLD